MLTSKSYPSLGVLFTFCTLVLLGGLAWVFELGLSVSFTFSFMAIAVSPYIKAKNGEGYNDPFNPYVVLSILFYLYGVSTLLYVEENGITYNSEIVSYSPLAEYAVICLLGQVGLIVGTFVSFGDRSFVIPQDARLSRKQLQLLIGPALVIALAMIPFFWDRFNFISVTSYAEYALESRLDRYEDVTRGVKDVFLRDSPTLVVLCAATVYLFRAQSALILRSAAFIVLGTFLTTAMLSGARSLLVLGALLPLIYMHYQVRRFSLIEMLVGSVMVYFFINSLAVMRLSSNFSEMVLLLQEDIVEKGYDFLRLSQSGELATSSNLLRLVAAIQLGETQHLLGELMISQFGAFIPRAIWPDRPFVGSELFVFTFYPGVLESGGGYGFFFHQDGYWDFGIPGVIFYAFVLGWLTSRFYKRYVILDRSSFSTLIYATLYGPLVLAVVRSGLIGSLKASLMAVFPLLLIVLLTRSGLLGSTTGDAVKK
jgi:oligosaccharide repeat unit polymerase